MLTVGDDFIRALPKAELHVHIEGTLEPEMMFALAARNRVIIPYADVAAVRGAYAFSRLQDFLDIYYAGADVLRSEADFHDLMLAYLARAAGDGVVHAEIMFDPQTHTARGVQYRVVVGGLRSGLAAGRAAFGISGSLILCFLRHLDEEAALATLAEAEIGDGLDGVVAVGLDSSEIGHPPAKFARVFARARAMGLHAVAHAGEEGPPEYVWQALNVLKVDRIDHGNRALEDAALVARLAAERVPLTVCPLSNVKLCVVSDMAAHPIDSMLAAGLCATVNSDDPAYFGGYVADNYRAIAGGRGLDRAALAQLARNSFAGSFLDAVAIAGHLAEVDRVMGIAG